MIHLRSVNFWNGIILSRDNSVTIHHRNIQILAIELFKVKLGVAPPFMSIIFCKTEESVLNSLRSQVDFYNYENPKSVYFGLETLRNLGPKIWNIIPRDMRNCNTVNSFKRNIKKWLPEGCPCRLGKVYVQGLGFM